MPQSFLNALIQAAITEAITLISGGKTNVHDVLNVALSAVGVKNAQDAIAFFGAVHTPTTVEDALNELNQAINVVKGSGLVTVGGDLDKILEQVGKTNAGLHNYLAGQPVPLVTVPAQLAKLVFGKDAPDGEVFVIARGNESDVQKFIYGE